MNPTANARDRLIVALDAPTRNEARALVDELGDSVSFYKIGLELLFAGGLELASELKGEGKSIFLDMKLLDIGNTVEKAVANVARLGLDCLTIHGVDRKTMDAAVRGRGSSSLKLLAVTVLTSLDTPDLVQQGIAGKSPAELVLHRAKMARDAGFDGVISSGHEAGVVRALVGNDFLIVTPGIRLAESSGNAAAAATNDQARVMTPNRAITAGASHLVVGRPITKAASPREIADRTIAEIQKAFV